MDFSDSIITNTDSTLSIIFNYLGLDSEVKVKHEFTDVSLTGRLGDPTGRYEYNKIEKSTLDKWKKTLDTKKRTSYAKKYLDKIGVEVLSAHGYDQSDLVCQIDSIKPRKLGYITDNLDLLIGFLIRFFDAGIIYKRIEERKKGKNKPIIWHT